MALDRQRNRFRPSDFDAVYYNHFKEIWDSGDIYADPSGWRDTEAAAAGLLPSIQIEKAALGRYYLDEGDTIDPLKEQIIKLIESWEQRPFDLDELTLYNSVSTATAAVLIALKRLGLSTIVFETPAYGVTVNQAKQAGYKIVMVPTYYENGFVSGVELYTSKRQSPFAVWLTQPRMSLGFDQKKQFIHQLLEQLSASDFLVIDEATEQHFPSLLSSIHQTSKARQVLRIRGLLKPLGLNGLRIAAVLHSAFLREHLEGAQEVIGASLDLYSLEMAAALAQRKELFISMLSVANTQVQTLRKKAEVLALGSKISVGRLVNGYMGTTFVNLQGGKKRYEQNRRDLLNHCCSRRMPVILGSSMFFALDPEWEQIRFNYFNRDHHILRAIEVLTGFSVGIHQ